MLGNFSWSFCRLLTFFKIFFFSKKIFQEHYQSVKQFGSRSGPTFCRSWSGSELFVKGIIGPQKSPLARKESIKKFNRFRAHYQIYLFSLTDQWLKWPYHQALIRPWPLKVTMLCYCLPSIHPIPWLTVEAGVMRKETDMLIQVCNKIIPCWQKSQTMIYIKKPLFFCLKHHFWLPINNIFDWTKTTYLIAKNIFSVAKNKFLSPKTKFLIAKMTIFKCKLTLSPLKLSAPLAWLFS